MKQNSILIQKICRMIKCPSYSSTYQAWKKNIVKNQNYPIFFLPQIAAGLFWAIYVVFIAHNTYLHDKLYRIFVTKL